MFGSSQSTILALKAIIKYQKNNKIFNGKSTIVLKINDIEIKK